ncbi:MAG TPA: 3-phosphoserine/phosphohydroxythreonine transaminase [Holophaga sp.]|nr:3-phosphoserine/phosphohydroxythreonine transaminase [Holophaga sp.]HPS67992.1 3-phosphoserine/phosphohydroxythreonine transaminase [Holophaga sp.]
MTNRVINFYAGPAGLPLEPLKRAQDELLDFAGTGMSVMEISHRAKEYDAVHEEALSLVRELMGLPSNYKVLLLQGGAHLSFGMIPLNLLRGGRKADYILTGNWAEKAYKEAKLVGGDNVRVAASTKDEKFARLPKASELKIGADSAYVHFTSNNTVEGTQWKDFPKTDKPYICDMSSDIMWRPFDPSQFGMIYAGAQKNLGPSGVTLVIIREDFLEMCEAQDLPSYLRFKIHAEKNSLYNTPPCFGIYILRNVLAYNKSIGGLKAIEANNLKKAEILYGCIDKHAGFFKPFVTEKADRSVMNVDFFLPTEELTASFVSEAKKNGMVGLKGYRDIGGIRVSTYNAVTVDNVKTLVGFMEEFVKKNG